MLHIYIYTILRCIWYFLSLIKIKTLIYAKNTWSQPSILHQFIRTIIIYNIIYKIRKFREAGVCPSKHDLQVAASSRLRQLRYY